MRDRWVWLLSVLVRFGSALVSGTFFSPDEYWQCGEVAHALVFGYGALTWEWHAAIRPVLPLLPFALLYALLKALQLDLPHILARSPLVLQALFASWGDVAMHRTARRLADPRTARWLLALQLSSHFMFYCIVRPFSNSLETVLVQLSLSVWPWSIAAPSGAHLPLALLYAALAVAVRPTAALVFVPLALDLVRHCATPVALVCRYMLPVGGLVMGASLLLDRIYYGEWLCTLCRFVRFNATPGLAARYGTQPWHWYATGALPALLGPFLPLSLFGMLFYAPPIVPITVLFFALVLSLNPHKEFRFLLPILPLMLFAAALTVARIRFRWPTFSRFLLPLLLASSLSAGLYLATLHQRGPITLMAHLAREPKLQSLLLLMPCHSTPLYSHLHRNVSVKSLDCEPPLWAPPGADVQDEADVFYSAPLAYLTLNYHPSLPASSLPSHIAFFASLLPTIRPWLFSAHYNQVHYYPRVSSSHITAECRVFPFSPPRRPEAKPFHFIVHARVKIIKDRVLSTMGMGSY